MTVCLTSKRDAESSALKIQISLDPKLIVLVQRSGAGPIKATGSCSRCHARHLLERRTEVDPHSMAHLLASRSLTSSTGVGVAVLDRHVAGPSHDGIFKVARDE